MPFTLIVQDWNKNKKWLCGLWWYMVSLTLNMPWCTILDRFGGNFCEKNIPPKFCKKIDCGLWLRHGIMSLFNTQQSFEELEVIFRGVKNSGNQEVQQKTLWNFVPFGNTCKKMQKNVSNNWLTLWNSLKQKQDFSMFLWHLI